MFDTSKLHELMAVSNADGEFALNARNWTGSIEFVVDEQSTTLELVDGNVVKVVAAASGEAGPGHIRLAGTEQMWNQLLAPIPRAPFTDPLGASYVGMTLEGGPWSATRHLAVRRLVELLRHLQNGTDHAPNPRRNVSRHGQFDAAVGRYVHLDLDGLDHRIYFEEAGSGVALLCQHTAGADARQWRHLLEDERVTRNFRVIAYDLPYHGRSIPPEGRSWWAEKYALTRDFAMSVPVALSSVLDLDRPVFIGSSVGGMLALDLARYHADEFRAVIACEAALKIGLDTDDARDEAGSVMDPAADPALYAALMMTWMGATAPETYRQETRLHYAQGAPGVFVGDLFYFSTDHDLRGEANLIDTSRCAVHMLTGEYDWITLGASAEAAAQIPGATYEVMNGLGHFPMSEDPDRFIDFVLPILDGIAATA